MTPENKQQLISAIKNAEKAAIAADPGQDADGGTCNFDTPAIRISHIRESTMQGIAEDSGIKLISFHWFGNQKWYWVRTSTMGQGNRRTTMMQSALKILKDESPEDVQVMGYYQMD
ncbi:MAG: hypothetical protein P9M03_06880 [Candidatus Theseobacter exili]|nr:hypothetical protein [Candidatus Theseobacter exili]